MTNSTMLGAILVASTGRQLGIGLARCSAISRSGETWTTNTTSPKVRDVMSHRPVTVGPNVRVSAAGRLLREGQIPTSRSSSMTTDWWASSASGTAAFSSILWDLSPSLRARFEQARQALEEIEVGDVMTREPVTTTPDARLAEAAAQMFEHRIGCLPVVKGGCLVGLSTEADALAALADSLGHVLVWSWSGSSAPRAGSEHVLGHDSARPRGTSACTRSASEKRVGWDPCCLAWPSSSPAAIEWPFSRWLSSFFRACPCCHAWTSAVRPARPVTEAPLRA
jgi:CBS domain-containing protein